MTGPKVTSPEERALSALWEFCASVRWGKALTDTHVESGCFLNGMLHLALLAGIDEGRIAELVEQPEKKIRKWIASSSATPRNYETTKLVVSKLGSEITSRWRAIYDARNAAS